MIDTNNQAEPKIGVLYEDSDVLVLDKPAGLVVHGDGKTSEKTLADWLLAHYSSLKGVGEPWQQDGGETIERPGIVHRLDRETSGVILIAKNQAAYEFLKKEFQERTAQKTYNAFVYGNLKEASGVINKSIGRSPADFRRWSAQPGARGEKRAAVTEWKLVRQGTDADTGEKVAYLELHPLTGRTHQIRVHLKAIHHPVVSDSLYATGKPQALGFVRTALHAHKLAITLPSGAVKEFMAPLPADFLQALEHGMN
jgi:23S rRNA pseudouridine1911/1915/1917 synthase